MKLDKAKTLKIIQAAIREDVGAGDITTLATVGREENVRASIVAGEGCIVCGMDVAKWCVNKVDASVRFKARVKDGRNVRKGKEIAFLKGPARAILSAERTMLNFLCFLSGIATCARKFAGIAGKYGVKIYDTRKTLPLLRYLEKFAVLTGGGHNHRFGLWDQALVKENHFRAGRLDKQKNIVSAIREKIKKNIKIEVEVENLREFKHMLVERPDIIMLDNMPVKEIKKAVGLRDKIKSGKKPLLEASGGITVESVENYARTGVDRISIGSITDSVNSVDMSLEIM